MKTYNEESIEQLRELEYSLRDGLVYNEAQAQEVMLLCEQITDILKERTV